MKIESKIGKLFRPSSDIFLLLSDFTKIASLIPPDQVKNFNATVNSCSFEVEKAGIIELKIIETEPNSLIKYSGGGSIPMSFYFWVQLKEISTFDTRIKLTLKADIPVMMQFLVKSKIEKALNDLIDKISAMYPSESQTN
jgi:hypothetical protein